MEAELRQTRYIREAVPPDLLLAASRRNFGGNVRKSGTFSIKFRGFKTAGRSGEVIEPFWEKKIGLELLDIPKSHNVPWVALPHWIR